MANVDHDKLRSLMNDHAKLMLHNYMSEKMKRHQSLKVEEMSCWARFKYDKNKPSLKVHIWDIFDEASLETTTFETFFERIFQMLGEIYQREKFSLDLSEVSEYNGESVKEDDKSDDSASVKLMEEINRAVTFNILDKNIERHRSFRDDF